MRTQPLLRLYTHAQRVSTELIITRLVDAWWLCSSIWDILVGTRQTWRQKHRHGALAVGGFSYCRSDCVFRFVRCVRPCPDSFYMRRVVLSPGHEASLSKGHSMRELALSLSPDWLHSYHKISTLSWSQSLTTTSPLGIRATPSQPHSPRMGACRPLPSCCTPMSHMWREQ